MPRRIDYNRVAPNAVKVFEEVRRHFSEKELVDLTLIVASMNAWNRIAIRFRQGPVKRGGP